MFQFLPSVLLTNQYIVEGEVPIQPGVIQASFCKWGLQYHVEFDIKLIKYPDVELNILQMTIGEDYGRHGDRIPMVGLDFFFVVLVKDIFQGLLLHIPTETRKNMNLPYTIRID